MSRNSQFLVATSVVLILAAPAVAQQCIPVECAGVDDCTLPIFGGQTILAGATTISNDGDYLFVQINTTGGWEFDTAHIYVGNDPVPTNGGGNVRPGHFPYNTEFPTPVTTHTQVIALSSLGIDTSAPDCEAAPLHLVAHTALLHIDGQEETGYTYGETEFSGRRWGWSACYEVACSLDPPACDPEVDDCDPPCDPEIEDCDGGGTDQS